MPSPLLAGLTSNPADDQAIASLIAIERGELGVVEIGGQNRGPAVEQYIAAAHGQPGQPWCMAFQSWGLLQMAKHVGRPMPIRPTMGCQAAADEAVAKGIRYLHPMVGAIGLLWFPTLHRFAHAYLVTHVLNDGRVETIEGNSNAAGGREGYGVVARLRHVAPTDRFIWWWLATAP